MRAFILFFLILVADPLPRALTIQDVATTGPFGNLINPNALQFEDVERWARMLDASPPELEFMQTNYGTFVERHNQFLETECGDYLKRCNELGSLQKTSRLTSPAVLVASKGLQSSAQKLRAGLQRIELEYIDALVPGYRWSLCELDRARQLGCKVEGRCAWPSPRLSR